MKESPFMVPIYPAYQMRGISATSQSAPRGMHSSYVGHGSYALSAEYGQ